MLPTTTSSAVCNQLKTHSKKQFLCCNCWTLPSTSVGILCNNTTELGTIKTNDKIKNVFNINNNNNVAMCQNNKLNSNYICNETTASTLPSDAVKSKRLRKSQQVKLSSSSTELFSAKAQSFVSKFMPLMEKCQSKQYFRRKFYSESGAKKDCLPRKPRSTLPSILIASATDDSATNSTQTINKNLAFKTVKKIVTNYRTRISLKSDVKQKLNGNVVDTLEVNCLKYKKTVRSWPQLLSLDFKKSNVFKPNHLKLGVKPNKDKVFLTKSHFSLVPPFLSSSSSSVALTPMFNDSTTSSPSDFLNGLCKDAANSKLSNHLEPSTPTTCHATTATTITALSMIGESKTFNQLLKNSLLQVSVDTMAITALPLDCWLKERLKNWVQLSGHEGTIVPASNHTIWKKQPCSNTAEAIAYSKIMKDNALRGLTPKFFKEIMHKNESFIEIQDLLSQFPNTSTRAVMDIKIGTRTFLESEVSNSTKRTDLYKKMINIAPNEPTEQEHADGAITKLRYMQFRERESSTASLGFRIEAAQMLGGKLQKCFKKVQTMQQVYETLMNFFGNRYIEICTQLYNRFKTMRLNIEKSQFFRAHEVVGSSILIVYDELKANAWMIDFAKSLEVPEGIVLNHRSSWELGNHEDGYLTGLDNLIKILERQSQNENDPPLRKSKNMKNSEG